MTLARASIFTLLLMSLALTGCGAFITPQHRIDTARRDMREGKWQAAAAQLRVVVQSHPRNPEAWQLLAEVSFDAGDLNGAQSALEHAVAAGAKGPDLDALRTRVWLAAGKSQAVLDADARRALGLEEPARTLAVARAYLTLGQADKAIQMLNPLLAQQPGLTEARVVTAQALATEGQLDPALEQLQVAMQHDSGSPQPPLLQGTILEAQGRHAAAERALALALQRMPAAQPFMDRMKALVPLTEARLAQGEIDAAAQSEAILLSLAPDAPVVQLLGARIKLGRRDLSGGAGQLQALVARMPNYTAARIYLGAAELAQGNLQQARADLEQAVEEAPENVEARKLLASAELKVGQPEEALKVLIPALGLQPADAQLFALLQAASRAGGTQAMLETVEQEFGSNPKNPTLALNLAQLQLATGDPAGARATLEAGLAANPETLGLRFALAGVYLRTKDFDQALNVLEVVARSKPEPAVEFAIARVDLARGDAKRADAALDQAIAMRPGQPALVEDAGLLLLQAGNYAAALDRVNALLASEPHDPGALALKGDIEAALKDRSAALAAYTQAQEQRPTESVALKLYQLRLAAHVPDPQQPLQRWLEHTPSDWRAREALGGYYITVGSLQAAAQELETVVKEAPREVPALNDLAWVYGKLGDPRAQTLGEQAYRLAPRSPDVNDTLGWILARRHDSARAVQLLALAAGMRPADPDVEYHYAYALIADGKQNEARQILTRILSTPQPFDSRADAQRLLASMKAT